MICVIDRDSHDPLPANVLVRTQLSHRVPSFFVLQDILHHPGGPGGMVVEVSVPGCYNVIAII